MIALEAKTQPFACGHFHIVECTLYVRYRDHLQRIVRRSQQVEVTGIPDGRLKNKPN